MNTELFPQQPESNYQSLEDHFERYNLSESLQKKASIITGLAAAMIVFDIQVVQSITLALTKVDLVVRDFWPKLDIIFLIALLWLNFRFVLHFTSRYSFQELNEMLRNDRQLSEQISYLESELQENKDQLASVLSEINKNNLEMERVKKNIDPNLPFPQSGPVSFIHRGPSAYAEFADISIPYEEYEKSSHYQAVATILQNKNANGTLDVKKSELSKRVQDTTKHLDARRSFYKRNKQIGLASKFKFILSSAMPMLLSIFAAIVIFVDTK